MMHLLESNFTRTNSLQQTLRFTFLTIPAPTYLARRAPKIAAFSYNLVTYESYRSWADLLPRTLAPFKLNSLACEWCVPSTRMVFYLLCTPLPLLVFFLLFSSLIQYILHLLP